MLSEFSPFQSVCKLNFEIYTIENNLLAVGGRVDKNIMRLGNSYPLASIRYPLAGAAYSVLIRQLCLAELKLRIY